jgi:hypothetical protein
MTYNEPIFTKLAIEQQRRVQNFCIKFHPYPTNNTENRVKIILHLKIKYYLYSINSDETRVTR